MLHNQCPTINTEDLNVSDDLVITDDLTVGGNVGPTENIILIET